MTGRVAEREIRPWVNLRPFKRAKDSVRSAKMYEPLENPRDPE
jgi:hypothetical protein